MQRYSSQTRPFLSYRASRDNDSSLAMPLVTSSSSSLFYNSLFCQSAAFGPICDDEVLPSFYVSPSLRFFSEVLSTLTFSAFRLPSSVSTTDSSRLVPPLALRSPSLFLYSPRFPCVLPPLLELRTPSPFCRSVIPPPPALAVLPFPPQTLQNVFSPCSLVFFLAEDRRYLAFLCCPLTFFLSITGRISPKS